MLYLIFISISVFIWHFHIYQSLKCLYHPGPVKNIHQWFSDRFFSTRDALWWSLTSGHRLPTFLFATLSLGWNPITSPSQSYWGIYSFPTTVQQEEAEQRFTLVRSLTLHLSWHVSSYHQTSCCSESLSVWLTYINCHSMPQYTWILTQVMTIKTVLAGVRALCVAFV